VGIKIKVILNYIIKLFIIFILLTVNCQLNAQQADSKRYCTDFNQDTYDRLINFTKNNYPNIKFDVSEIKTENITVVQDTSICSILIDENIDPIFKTEITIYKNDKYYFKIVYSEMQLTVVKVEKTKIADEYISTERLDLGPNIVYIYDLDLNIVYKWQWF